MSLLLLFNGGAGAFIPPAPVGLGGVRQRRRKRRDPAWTTVETLARDLAPAPAAPPSLSLEDAQVLALLGLL